MARPEIAKIAVEQEISLEFSFKILKIRASFGSLAQSVEQLAFNQLVAGSNLARPTIYPANWI